MATRRALVARRVPGAPHLDSEMWDLRRCLFLFVIPQRSGVEGPPHVFLSLCVLAVVGFRRHPERSLARSCARRSRRTPTKPTPPQPLVPFSHRTPAVACTFLFVIPQRSGGICFCRCLFLLVILSEVARTNSNCHPERARSASRRTCGCLFLLVIRSAAKAPCICFAVNRRSLYPVHEEKTEMGRPERQLRIIQVLCIVFVASCILLTHSLVHGTKHISFTLQIVAILFALWTAYSGFWLQRLLARVGSNPERLPATNKKSTPFTRWRAGHLMRLATATSVGLWGFVLYFLGGSSWLVDALLALGLLLLLLWSPGSSPDSTLVAQ